MTVLNLISEYSYNGDGTSTAFPFTTYFIQNADVKVVLIDALGAETPQVITTNYTIVGAGSPSGGAVTMLVSPPAGSKLKLYLDPDLKQEAQYTETGKFPAASHERALDKQMQISQRLKKRLDDAIPDIAGAGAAALATLSAALSSSLASLTSTTSTALGSIATALAAAIASITGQQTTSVGAVNTAGATQVGAVNTAGGTQVGAVNTAGATQTGNVNTAGTTQTGNVNSAGGTQVAAVNSAGATQVGNVNTAGTTQTGNVNSAGGTQVAAVAAQGVTSTGLVTTEGNNQVDRVIAASATKIYDSTADALSNGVQTAVVNAPGTGGTNGPYTVPINNGGGTQGLLKITVAGNALSAINKILNPGKNFATPPTTIDLTGTGLTGATITTTIGANQTLGTYFGVKTATAGLFDWYQVTAGPAATFIGTAPSLAQVLEIQNAGGTKNLWPDPFFINTNLAVGYGSSAADTPYTFNATTWDPVVADSLSPYPDGKVIQRPIGASTTTMLLLLDSLGLAEGDVFQIAMEARSRSSGPYTSAAFVTLTFRNRAGATIAGGGNVLVPTAANPLTNTAYHMFNSGNITIPVGAFEATLTFNRPVADGFCICSMQIGKPLALSKPVQRFVLPKAAERIAALEAANVASPANNVLMRRTTFPSSTAAALVGTWSGGTGIGFVNNSGGGASFLTAACPAGGFNVVANQWIWSLTGKLTGVSRIIVVVRTSLTGVNPLNNGKLVAWGYIDTDPTLGGAGSEPIQLFAPDGVTPKTVMPADLLDVWGIGYIGANALGSVASTQFWVDQQNFSNIDPSFQFINFPANGGRDTGWSMTGALPWRPRLFLATSPVTSTNVPSASFATAVAALVDEPPTFLAPTRKTWGVVGREASLYFDPLLTRDYKRTNFRPSAIVWPANSGLQEERLKVIPAAAGTITTTLEALRGDVSSSSCVCTFVSVAPTAAAGNKVVHVCGSDSIWENGATYTALKVIEASQAVTTTTFIGSHTANGFLSDAYSGKSLGAFRGATLVGANPFYDGADFNYGYWLTNTAGPAGFANANLVVIEAGGVDVGAFTSDAAATTAADGWATTAEVIVASIRAALPSAAIAIQTMAPGPIGIEDLVGAYGPTWRQRRNWKILNARQTTQFSGREGSGIYVIPAGSSIDPEMGWTRTFTPRNAAVTRDMTTYTTYALMVADLSKGAGSIAFATDAASYFVKVGPTSGGRWREAELRDGFVFRPTIDNIHPGAVGAIQTAEAVWALIKNVL